jgi:hypothetical protein
VHNPENVQLVVADLIENDVGPEAGRSDRRSEFGPWGTDAWKLGERVEQRVYPVDLEQDRF